MSVFRCVILIALLCEGLTFSAATETVRVYSNAEYKYRFAYPASWHLSVVQGKGGPTLYNYDLSLAPGHGLLPQDGAEIFVIPHADLSTIQHSRSPREWATEDVRRFAHGESTLEAISNLGNPDVSDALRVAYDYQPTRDDNQQKYVAFYFRLNGALFKVELNYWKVDPSGPLYEQTLLSIVKSFRSITVN